MGVSEKIWYHLVNIQKTMGNQHCWKVNQLFLLQCSIENCQFTIEASLNLPVDQNMFPIHEWSSYRYTPSYNQNNPGIVVINQLTYLGGPTL